MIRFTLCSIFFTCLLLCIYQFHIHTKQQIKLHFQALTIFMQSSSSCTQLNLFLCYILYTSFSLNFMEFNVRLFLQFLTEISVHTHKKFTTLPFCVAVFLCQKCRQILQNRLWMQGYKLLPANLKIGMVLSWVSCFNHLFNKNLQEEIKWEHIESISVIYW
jgi:hypothetical protein